MKSADSSKAEYRHGDWGPAYLIKGDSSEMGVLRLRPGDAVDNHYHQHCDESFVIIEGECALWIDGTDSHRMRFGDVYRCEPGEMHYLVNDTDADFRCIFIKSPASPDDTHVVEWAPGQPAPPQQP